MEKGFILFPTIPVWVRLQNPLNQSFAHNMLWLSKSFSRISELLKKRYKFKDIKD